MAGLYDSIHNLEAFLFYWREGAVACRTRE